MRTLTALLAFATLLVGAACTHFGTAGLAPGVATEADVHARLGRPGMTWAEPDGSRLLEYSGQPNGTFCWMITIGPDGKVREIRQAFTEATFGRVVPGLNQDQVRRLLGRPEETVRFRLKPDEDVWSWRIEETSDHIVHFNVYFGREDRVLRTDRSVFYKPSGPSMN